MARYSPSLLCTERLEHRVLLVGDLVGDFGDAASLAVDVNTDVAEVRVLSFLDVGGEIYLLANRGNASVELWKPSEDTTEPQPLATAFVNTNRRLDSYCCPMEVVGDDIFFVVNAVDDKYETDEVHWVQGRVQLHKYNIPTGDIMLVGELGEWWPEGQVSTRLMADGDSLLITTEQCCQSSRTQFWRSDGTPEGTKPYGRRFALPFYSPVQRPVPFRGDWYFIGENDVEDDFVGLWRTDPDAETMTVLHGFGGDDFEGGLAGGLVTNGDALFFAADTGMGWELWTSDGTAKGTRMLKDIREGEDGSYPRHLTPFGEEVVFIATGATGDTEFWRTDGTEVGTRKVAEQDFGDNARIHPVVRAENTLYFGVDLPGPSFPTDSYELWSLTEDNLQLVREFERQLHSFTYSSGLLSFGASIHDQPHQHWISDGTRAGTRLLGEYRDVVFPVGGQLLMSNASSVLSIDGHGDLEPILEFPTLSLGSEPFAVTATDQAIFFLSGSDGTFYRSDGSAAGTEPIHNLDFKNSYYDGRYSSPPVGHITTTAEAVYAFGESGIWKSDLQGSSLKLLKHGVNRASTLIGSANSDGILYFVTADVREGHPTGRSEAKLWISDGTFDFTQTVVEPVRFDPPLPIAGTEPRAPQVETIGLHVAFVVGQQGWIVDVAANSTRPIPVAGLAAVATLGNRFFFLGYSEGSLQLWALAFGADQAKLVRTIRAESTPRAIPEMVEVDGAIYFSDGNGGLWRSDGTDPGTKRLAQFRPGLTGLADVYGQLFFSGDDGTHGQELWMSDGSPQGTRLAVDVWPGELSSHPTELSPVGNDLYFAADDGELGRELWKIQLDAPLVGDVNDNGRVEFADFLALAANYGKPTSLGVEDGDLDEDGAVTFNDFLALAANFGRRRITIEG